MNAPARSGARLVARAAPSAPRCAPLAYQRTSARTTVSIAFHTGSTR